MTTAVDQRPEGLMRRFGKGVRVTPLGLEFEDGLDYGRWEDVVVQLGQIQSASAWWIGDALTFGFYEYGRKYEQAIEKTGLDYGTLRNYASVAEQIELSRRRDNLSFGHHQDVAPLELAEQDAWLNRAEAENLSRMALRELLRESRQLPAADPGTTAPTLARIVWMFPAERSDRWKQVADERGVSLPDVVAALLDEWAEAAA